MEKVKLSYEDKFDLIRAYIEDNLPQNEFDHLCERVEGFEQQYRVQKENYDKVVAALSLEPISNIVVAEVTPTTEQRSIPLLIYNLDKKIRNFNLAVSDVLDKIQGLFLVPDLLIDSARSPGENKNEISRQIQGESIEDISVKVRDLTKSLYTVESISKVEIKVEFGEKEKYIEIGSLESAQLIKEKITKVLKEYPFEKLDRINFFILEK